MRYDLSTRINLAYYRTINLNLNKNNIKYFGFMYYILLSYR